MLLAAASAGCVGEIRSDVGESAPASAADAGVGEDPKPEEPAEPEEPEEPQEPEEPDGTAFLLPWTGAQGFRVSQGHLVGSHVGKGSYAWDFALPNGTLLRAAHDGVVRAVYGASTIGGCSSSYANDGNYVVIDRGDGLETLYLHLASTTVQVGEVVSRGDAIGTSGATGWACGAHLHFQIQASPDGGGTQSWYNASVLEYFHDTGMPYDPPLGSTPISANQQ